jgi:hypothetical protein
MDSFTYNSTPGIGMSYFRLPDKSLSWTSGISSLGKFNQTGENCLVIPTATPTNSLIPTPVVSLEPTSILSTSYDNIYLSEVMVAPASGDKEWIELYNDNDFTVFLEKWFIDDEENAGASPKTFSLTIPAKSYATFDLSTSVFNNDGDSVRLLDWQKQLKDSFEYSTSSKGKSLGRLSFDDDLFCIQESTKGRENEGCLQASPIPAAVSSGDVEITPPVTSPPAVLNLDPNLIPLKTATGSVPNPTGSVLGFSLSDTDQAYSKPNLIRPFSFISCSYSLLTIASILLKMKFNA